MGTKKQEAQQAAAIPYRRDGGKLRICLIHKPDNGAWGIPKGFVDPGDTKRETALKEAREEAGLHGRITGQRLGSYDYRKWGNTYTVSVFLMEVTDQDEDWEEDHFRERHWLKRGAARKQIKGRPFEDIFELAMDMLTDTEGDDPAD